MSRLERELYCRRCFTLSSPRGRGDAHPFALPGSKATYAPDRVCDVRHIRIDVALDFAAKRIRATCTQSLTVFNDGPTRLCLNAISFEISAITLGTGEALPYNYDGQLLSIDLGARKEGEALDVVIAYAATPRRGLYFIHPDEGYPKRATQLWSQGQDEDNRCWIPCFDHPHERATSEVIATVPEHMFALSNGKQLAQTHDAPSKTRTYHYRHDLPHPSYLITLVAGEYKVLDDKWEDVALQYCVAPGREDDAPRSFARTGEMMKLFSDKTGQKYPYGSYAQITVSEFIFGGMENTSATTLTDQTLHDARAHLDFSSEPLVAHELAHQWFGDLLTCRDWPQGWLNEGFATYMEIIWREHSAGRDEADYDRLLDQVAYLEEDGERYRRPIVTNVYHEPIDVFDRHLYEKGACVLHMLRRELGDARFWKGIRHYVQKHKGHSVETRDLVRALEEATGWNGDRFFEQWVFKAGYPALEAKYTWDDDAKLARLSIKQKQTVTAETPLFSLAITVRFVVDGNALDHKIAITSESETFLVPLAKKPTQVIIDSGNHFIKTLTCDKPDEVWHAELRQAELAIDRILAARALGKTADPSATDPLASAMREDKYWATRGEAALALGCLKTEAARDAIISALAQEKHPRTRRQMVRALGAFRGDEKAADVLLARLANGDESYFVEAECASAAARTRSPRAFDALKAAMHRPSFLDVIESACVQGMAELRDERGIALALDLVRYGQPVVGRRAAILSLGRLGAEFSQHKRAIRERLSDLLEDPDFRARIAVVEALSELGDPASASALKRAESKDLDGRVRRRAREVARALADGSSQSDALKKLRDAVEKLEEESGKLKDRVHKLEAHK